MKINENLRVEKLNESKTINGENNILFITAFFVSKLILFLTKKINILENAMKSVTVSQS